MTLVERKRWSIKYSERAAAGHSDLDLHCSYLVPGIVRSGVSQPAANWHRKAWFKRKACPVWFRVFKLWDAKL